jgi:hypothetical protein
MIERFEGGYNQDLFFRPTSLFFATLKNEQAKIKS